MARGTRNDVTPLKPRFLSLFEDKGGLEACWTWKGCLNSYGYGRIKSRGKEYLAHRIAYEHFVEPIPDGLTIDHLCRNKRCVNPAHMETVTRAENSRRKRGFYLTETCVNGHPWTKENTYKWLVPNSGGRVSRRCKTCIRKNNKARRARKKRAKS